MRPLHFGDFWPAKREGNGETYWGKKKNKINTVRFVLRFGGI